MVALLALISVLLLIICVFFFRYNPLLGKDTATRQQLPLKLSFGMTIHKSQGMTLEYVETVCNGIFTAGQLAVAIRRVKSTDGLAMYGFDPNVHDNSSTITCPLIY